jgi:fucose 4-O-acetylase-like acetyltransferase
MLYGSYSYESAKYGISYKLKFFLFALVWFVFFYLLLPNKKIPFVSILGSNTLTIYLFHGFYVKKLLKMKYFVFDPTTNMKIALLLTVLLILFYGNKYIAKFLRFIFCGEIFIFIYQKLYDMNILRDKQN